MVKRFITKEEDKAPPSLLEKNLELLANQLVQQALDGDTVSAVSLAVLKTGTNYLSTTKKVGNSPEDKGDAFNEFRERYKASSVGGSGSSGTAGVELPPRRSAEVVSLRVFDGNVADDILASLGESAAETDVGGSEGEV